MPATLMTFALSVGIVALSIVLLVMGRDILIPFAIAVMIWYLIDAVVRLFGRVRIGDWRLPGWVSLPAAIVAILIALYLVGQLIGSSIAQVIEAAPGYQANLQGVMQRIAQLFGLSEMPELSQITGELDLRDLATQFAAAATGIVSNAGLILVYVLFLMAEQRTFDRKMSAIFETREHEEEFRDLLHRIHVQIQSYLWIKTVMGLLTGAISYGVLVLVGVDFALFWGFVIFLLNYIPTIGALLGVIFPALMALVQFPSPVPFAIVVVVLGAIQAAFGNYIEPKALGNTLNLSPLVVMLSLVVWGSLWGIVGAILCVPITVIAMIVFAHFERTHPIAVLLSGTGRVREPQR